MILDAECEKFEKLRATIQSEVEDQFEKIVRQNNPKLKGDWKDVQLDLESALHCVRALSERSQVLKRQSILRPGPR